MTIRLLTLLLVLALPAMAPSQVCSAERPMSIRLEGATKADAPGRVTVDDLDRLPHVEKRLYDPFLKKEVLYRGVPLVEIVRQFSVPTVTTVRIRAVDEYQVDFSAEQWRSGDFILATYMDGERIPREKSGPAKIVMQTADPENRYVPKWIWLINRIEFLTD